MIDILEKLKSLNESPSSPAALPAIEDIIAVEEKLNVKLPPSYVKYQMGYSDVVFGHYELFQITNDGSYLDLFHEVNEARKNYDLENHLLPFVEDNGDYFCFDLNTTAPEYEVVYLSHNGIADERWKNFLDWVENCWIKEGLESGEDE